MSCTDSSNRVVKQKSYIESRFMIQVSQNA